MIYGYMLSKNTSAAKFEAAIKFADSLTYAGSNYTSLLESYIVYESFDFKAFKEKVINAIKRFFQKLKEAFERFLLNINYLKNAQLPKKQSEDLLYCLNLMKPRTLDGIDQIVKLFSSDIDNIKNIIKADDNTFYPEYYDRSGRNYSSAEKGLVKQSRKGFHLNIGGPDEKSDFEFEFGKSIHDIDESISALENSEQYKRIKDDDYENEKEIIAIPMNNIIKDMKESTKSLSEITYQLGQLEKAIKTVKESSPVFNKIAEMATSLCNKTIKYYNERITLLKIFFNSAKASIEAIRNNIKTARDGIGFETGVSTKSTKTTIRLKFTPEERAKVDEYRKILGELSRNRNFAEYRQKFVELCDILKVKHNCTLYFSNVKNDFSKESVFTCQILENKYRKVEVKGKILYHHRYDNDSIKELYPSAALFKNVSKADTNNKNDSDLPDTLFPEPRVYCHISVPLDKASMEMGKQMPIFYRAAGAKGFLYRIKNPEQYRVYIDDEQPKTAAYIVTDQDIPVEKIDANEMNEKIRNSK